MRENDSITVEKKSSNLTRWGIYALILLIVFLLGLVPMWLQKREVAQELETTQKQLRRSEIDGLLTTAIVESKRGEYEPARKETSEFFTRLDAEIKKEDESALTKDERGKLKSIFDNRDSTITMLAQRDQASVERLTDIYVAYRKAVPPVLSAAATSPPVSTPPAASPSAAMSPAPSPAASPALTPAATP